MASAPFYEPLRLEAGPWLAGVCAARRGAAQGDDRIWLDGPACAFAAIDGLGAHAGGGAAAGLAREALRQLLAGAPAADPQAALRGAVVAADAAISAGARLHAELREMGAVLVVAQVVAHTLFVAHVGDARAYACGPAGLQRLTRDHTAAGVPGGAGADPQRHRLQRVLGGNKRAVEPGLARHALRPGDSVLLCSDGVWAPLSDGLIESLLRAPGPAAAAAERLVQAARACDGSDDACAVVYRHGLGATGEGDASAA